MAEIFRGPDNSPKCAECPCSKGGLPERPIRGAGKLKSLAIVGEGPSTEEKHQGWPFVGPSGKLLQQAFSAHGIDRNGVWITNAILCQRPWDDEKLAIAVACCRPRLEHELSLVAPTALLALGGTAIESLGLPVSAVSDARGTKQTGALSPVPVVSSIHPAAILRGGSGEVSGGNQKMNVDAQYVFLEADVGKAWRLSQGQEPHWEDNIQLSTSPIDASIQVPTFLADVYKWGMLGIDLEWNAERQITWLGIATKTRALSLYWPQVASDSLVFGLLREAGEDSKLPKLFHNLQADIEVWEAQIGRILGPVEDTMLMHHAAFPGAAHDLQNVTSQFLLVPPWKANRGIEEKLAVVNYREHLKNERKALRKAEHEARNAQRKAEAVERKRVGKVKPSVSTDDILKLIGD